ncbi:MAG: hypothetical protein COW19_09100 [Zetaproteobacteria bacterium CG12_big_fil_rev_8_21_14_0_65_55_1124]|nr:MAG: hypothetical protein AUJ58_01630 [Zetaproteobacteria bacterium CG1_02_55_237]PIS18762.1 MAG: hypothetical protein COT53_09135 [Zetaproteobacteria bacterium CG08_land_8_20_14_0_20_55_17]PIW42254.1 MAG: hypothetical protein COW19_09100 [Zetaproteobacteria bacterium CG12_big_fil_rev_8_21_14_0_65_55_1124]PIY54020.1 MAG: hypothetical protein COZ01_01755 [Zetaproteobacteria bacterium CG_4_10_14_0_8_um_filter_55_43]PIZ37185.1 MAG: hypothetical protein COY36_09950 [Zetaproteobacteria bacterium 
MAVLLFKLRNVPDDEAADVRELLHAHDIAFYETTAGSWGVSMPGIWLHDDSRLAEARALLDTYQNIRQSEARSTYEQALARGERRTVFTLAAESPLKVILLLAALLFVLYISIMPFMRL